MSYEVASLNSGHLEGEGKNLDQFPEASCGRQLTTWSSQPAPCCFPDLKEAAAESWDASSACLPLRWHVLGFWSRGQRKGPLSASFPNRNLVGSELADSPLPMPSWLLSLLPHLVLWHAHKLLSICPSPWRTAVGGKPEQAKKHLPWTAILWYVDSNQHWGTKSAEKLCWMNERTNEWANEWTSTFQSLANQGSGRPPTNGQCQEEGLRLHSALDHLGWE